MTRFQPLGRKTGRPLEQATIVSISVGQVLEVKNSTVAWGGGLAIAVEPNVGSQPRTSKTSPGLNGHVNVENSFFHAAADLTFAIGIPKGQHDWARNLFVGNTEVGMFFNKTLGLRIMGSVKIKTETERQNQNQQFFQGKWNMIRTSLVGAFCVKAGPCIFFAGPEIRGTRETNSYLDQTTGVYQKNTYNPDKPIGFILGLNMIFNSEKK